MQAMFATRINVVHDLAAFITNLLLVKFMQQLHF
jgi:hypothetical protein